MFPATKLAWAANDAPRWISTRGVKGPRSEVTTATNAAKATVRKTTGATVAACCAVATLTCIGLYHLEMRPHPRIKKAVKWGGAATAAVLAVLWLVSGWWGFMAVKSGWCGVYLASGKVGVYSVTSSVTTQFFAGSALIPHWELNPWTFEWSFSAKRWQVMIPLWALVAAAVLASAGAWRLDVLARRGRGHKACPSCAYDRAGLAPEAPCPECGSVPPTV